MIRTPYYFGTVFKIIKYDVCLVEINLKSFRVRGGLILERGGYKKEATLKTEVIT